MSRKGFWGKFDDLMDALPGHIESEIEAAENSINVIGKGNVIQTSSRGKSVQIVNGTKIVTESVNGKTKTTINGEEMVPKKYADEMMKTLEECLQGYGENTFYHKHMTKAINNYKKYRGKK